MADTWVNRITYEPGAAAYWTTQSSFSGTTLEPLLSPDYLPVSEVQMVFTRAVPTGVTDDVMVTHLAFSKRLLAGTWDLLSSADKATVEGFLATLWTTQRANTPSTITLREYRWHDYHDTTNKPGPAVRVTAVGTAGTGSAATAVPDQVSTTVTFRTASRKHWGRVYYPKTVAGNYDTYGRVASALCDSLALSFRTLLNSAEAAGLPAQVMSHGHRGMLSVSSLACDSTPDIIRRRRPRRPSYMKVYTS